jgi:urease accessory protein
VVSRAYATSPLRLLMPRNAGHAAWVYTSSFGGGLVEGDHLAVDLDVGSGATAFVSTQASTKVYRSVRGTSVDVHARLAPDACLVFAPDPTVCFAASRYRQTERFDLAAGSSLVLVDWLSSGRHASGERWAFAEYHSRIQVHRCGGLVVNEALRLRAEDGDVSARLGRFDVLGLALLMGAAVHDRATAILEAVARYGVSRRADLIVTAAPVDDGCLLRFGGTSVEQAARTLRAHLDVVPGLLGDDPWARKW